MRVAALNIASGRGSASLRDGLAPLAGCDVLALSEVDDAQPRSGGIDQAAVAAEVLGVEHWRMAPTLAGTPGLRRDWTPLAGTLRSTATDPTEADSPETDQDDDERGHPPRRRPTYGVALLVSQPVTAWHALGLGTGRGKLPLVVPDPVSGRTGVMLFPDEPRAAVAAVLTDGTVVAATHLSFAPPTALSQLRRLASWLRGLAPAGPDGATRPVLLAGDLNLPAPLVGLAAGAPTLVRAPTFPGAAPRVQLDHVVSLGAPVTATGRAEQLAVGDHRALVVDVVR
ncbi:Metal-dependent hydrolase, endonuclease/exonuclease/phosphatase family [Quadrisphaera granulorum]|uniref:Endonuclease/exonuclease/phosphatase family metal-dependent hydrolase n=1 Tax=Quadrisphaera granulorum TaxID=317664 RepID=A0A316AH10_9ACTN|nr:endonuclease/exonuclease/phosphatase family protein [Quadrisphaera granulorum]PWJ56230.1 endonuclease/exonuclease/phosphatase family metal-dependent hydrolase [Quadrisphaera granulorum]SZE94864.1 Metal-dependent hydrolase, endonuclease/exonuclease/phosphatase family [Quadrisphaera granulorum]